MTTQKALVQKSTSTNTETQENQFEGRGFAVQKKSDTHTQKSDLNTLLLQAKTFGHSISKLAGQESSSASPQTNGLSIQAKLSIGEPGDRYEQEADRVASVVVQRINTPSSTGESVQREAMPEDEEELQMKPLADSIQRVEIDDEEELQMKTQVQCREAIGGGEASEDLETAINSAKGGGQSLDAGLQRSIGQAMGADFSGVKVHTDAQADQLNQSIQAKAFTTGQDVFFRQGEYNPGGRGGQELIAHELTHVVQQSRGQIIQRGGCFSKALQQVDDAPPEATYEGLLNGDNNVEMYMNGGVCYDAVAYVLYKKGSITKDQLTGNTGEDWLKVFNFNNGTLWTGGAIDSGKAIGFYRLHDKKFFHAAISVGGTTIRAINGHLLGAGWMTADLGQVLQQGNDGIYQYDNTQIQVYISPL